jgi:VWFA-related protein
MMAGASLVLMGGAMLAQSRSPQPQQRPTFRAGVELVQVDVDVPDEHGLPVTGLTEEDFTIFDRLRALPVATFTQVAHEWKSDGPVPPIDARSEVADNSSARSERLVVLVVDDLGLWKGREELVRGLAHRVVSEVGPDSSMAVVFTSGRHNVEVTQDRGALHAAIDQAVGVYYAFRRGDETAGTLTQVATALESAADKRRKAVIVITEWIAGDSRGVFDVPGALTPPPGSSIGFGNLGGAADSGRETPGPPPLELVRLMNRFRRANVALYGIDPRGRLQTTHERMVESRGESPLLRRDDPLIVSQETFTETMEATGGFAIVDTNDFDAGLDRVIADLDHYYLLGFYPEEPTDEKWHDLQVMVNRPGLSVRHRRGYQLGNESEAKAPANPLVALSTGVLPNTDLPLRAFAAPVARVRNDARVAVAAEVRVPAETLRRPGGRLEDTVEVAILAVDVGRSKVTRSTHQTVDVTVPVSRVNSEGEVTYQVVLGLDLPPASYQLRVSARSSRADRAWKENHTIVLQNVSH